MAASHRTRRDRRSLDIACPPVAAHPREFLGDRPKRVRDEEAAGAHQQDQECHGLLEEMDDVSEERERHDDRAVHRRGRAVDPIVGIVGVPPGDVGLAVLPTTRWVTMLPSGSRNDATARDRWALAASVDDDDAAGV